MFVLIHGPLDNFNCFQYENYLGDIKKSIKSIIYPLQEVFNRLIEKQNILYGKYPPQLFSQSPALYNEIKHNIFSQLIKSTDILYEKMILPFSNTLINTLKEKDKNIMLNDGSIVSVHHIVQPYKKPVKLLVNSSLTILNQLLFHYLHLKSMYI